MKPFVRDLRDAIAGIIASEEKSYNIEGVCKYLAYRKKLLVDSAEVQANLAMYQIFLNFITKVNLLMSQPRFRLITNPKI